MYIIGRVLYQRLNFSFYWLYPREMMNSFGAQNLFLYITPERKEKCVCVCVCVICLCGSKEKSFKEGHFRDPKGGLYHSKKRIEKFKY